MKKSSSLLLAGVLAVSLVLGGCNKASVGGGDKVATVNGIAIPTSEYQQTYEEFKTALGIREMPEGNPDEKKLAEETLKQMTLNKLIAETLIQNEAKKYGIKVSDKDVQDYKNEQLDKQPGMREMLALMLKEKGMTEKQFDEELRNNILVQRFIEKAGGAKIAVADAEVQQAYSTNKQHFTRPARVKARHILVAAPDKMIKDQIRAQQPDVSDAELAKAVAQVKKERLAKAQQIFNQVKANPAKFADLAKTQSDDKASGQQGGELGYMMQAQIDPDFWRAIEKTPNNQLYPGVVTTQFGYHIVFVQDHQPAGTVALDEIKDDLRMQLAEQKKQDFLRTWLTQELQRAQIVYEEAYRPQSVPAPGQKAPTALQGAVSKN